MKYSGSTPIMKAQGMNELEIVSTLTQAGANLDIQDAYGYTITHYMAKAKDEAGLEIVLPYCPNLTIRDHEMNLTAADLALANGYISTAQLLLGAMADNLSIPWVTFNAAMADNLSIPGATFNGAMAEPEYLTFKGAMADNF
ncbi:E3 ubiquitin-protein ligase mib1-like [Macrobrachium rosenbergii]|uniref:E3 ubiquitin-protein ligase mib1-like n=1 Tax=Macrobrachium rosenbergii TaxID=79674 RepID=UPI0034D46808